MAATATTGLFVPTRSVSALSPSAASLPLLVTKKRRRITPEAGHALEILGHAIEYLTDEFVHEGGSMSGSDHRIQAVQLLMALNRKVYFECPEVPSFAERCRSLLGLRAA